MADLERYIPPQLQAILDRTPARSRKLVVETWDAAIKSARPFVCFDPARRSGQPTVNLSRLPVEAVAGYVIAGESVKEVADEYDITRADVLVACWWMGTYGTRRWRRWWGHWAKEAHEALWHSRYDVPDPPDKDEAEERYRWSISSCRCSTCSPVEEVGE